MSIKLLDDFVRLEPESHTYHDRNRTEYTSVSKFLSFFCKKFDRETISRYSAIKKGISQEEVLQEWDAIRDSSIDHGNRIHEAIERYEKTTFIRAEDEELRPLIISVTKEYSSYYRSYPEQVLYDEENLLAGTCDKLLVHTSHKASVISISDYKTNQSKGIEFTNKYNQYMLGPVDHLQDCNYNKYSLQLSTYAYMLQKKTGCKIGSLHIHFIPPDNMLDHHKIPVPYLKDTVIEMIKYWKSTTIIK